MKNIICMLFSASIYAYSITAFSADGLIPPPPEIVPVAGSKVFGRVFLKSAWKNADITIKDRNGGTVGLTKTNDYGQYSMDIDSEVKPPFIVKAVSKSGDEVFGIGNEYSVNITPLSDWILSKWYDGKRKLSYAFNSLNDNNSLPDINDLQIAVGQIFTEINEYIGEVDYDVLSDVIDNDVENLLRSVIFEDDGSLIKLKYRNVLVGRFELKYLKESNSGSLIITGKNYGREIDGSSEDVKLSEKYSAPYFARIDQAVYLDKPSVTASRTPAHDWMNQDSKFIEDKLLAEIAIPGTHDSGTAGIGGDTGHTVAATQEKSIHEQLEDGIRYFDLRADEYSKKSCADGSDFYVFHGDGATRYLSYRFNDVLMGIKNFLDDQSHGKEIIIIDMQQISAGSSGSEAVFFRSVQEILGPYLMDNRIESYQWWRKPIREIWEYNQKNNVHGQVILLVGGGWFLPPRSGCSAAMNKDVWLSRDDFISGFWRGGRRDFGPILDDITSQLSMSTAIKQDRRELFTNYRKKLEEGKLNALNLAPQPSDLDYASWVFKAQFSNKTRDYLIKYSDFNVNYFANITGASNESSKNCWSAALGKIAMTATKNYYLNQYGWNPVNIVMVDAYSRSNFWSSVSYDSNKKYIFSKATGFVDFIRQINYAGFKPAIWEQRNLEEQELRQCL